MPTARPAADASPDEFLPPNCGPTGQQLAALDAAVATAFPAFGSLAPNDSADIKGRQHAYINLPGLLEAVRPALMTQQVMIGNTISLVPGGFVVNTMLRHSAGGWRLSQFPVVSLTSSSAISAAATSGFRVNLQLLLGICASDEDAAYDAAPATAAAPQPWDRPGPIPQQQPWAAPAPQGDYDMTRAIPQHEIAAAVAAAQQPAYAAPAAAPNPSAYV